MLLGFFEVFDTSVIKYIRLNLHPLSCVSLSLIRTYDLHCYDLQQLHYTIVVVIYRYFKNVKLYQIITKGPEEEDDYCLCGKSRCDYELPKKVRGGNFSALDDFLRYAFDL
jgi:hypothetical protein